MAAKDANTAKTEVSTDSAAPMLDMSQTAVRKMITQARARGYITYDELNTVLPPDQVSSEQIEDVMAMLSGMGINVIEAEDADDDAPVEEESTELEGPSSSRVLTTISPVSENLDRTDDPVRMYLREMGSVEWVRSPSQSVSRPAATR